MKVFVLIHCESNTCQVFGSKKAAYDMLDYLECTEHPEFPDGFDWYIDEDYSRPAYQLWEEPVIIWVNRKSLLTVKERLISRVRALYYQGLFPWQVYDTNTGITESSHASFGSAYNTMRRLNESNEAKESDDSALT